MRVLIVGCGYLGLRAARLWRDSQATVFAVTRSPERADELAREGIGPILGDVTAPDTLRSLPEVDVCLYAVGYDRRQAASKREVYVQGLKHVLAVLEGRCPRFIYISSSSVYSQDAGEVVNEDSQTRPTSEGGQICLEAEQLVHEFVAATSARRAVILRLSGIYGPGRLLARIDQLRSGATLSGNPDAWLNLIHVDDAARAVFEISRQSFNEGPRTWLLSDAAPVRRQEFYSHLAGKVGGPEPAFLNDDPGLNKRCDSTRIRAELPLTLQYPTWREGLDNALSD